MSLRFIVEPDLAVLAPDSKVLVLSDGNMSEEFSATRILFDHLTLPILLLRVNTND